MSAPAFDIKRLIHTTKTTKRFWLPLFIVVLVAVNAAMVFVPKKYQSDSTVLINKPKISNLTGPLANVLNITDELGVIRETITSFVFMDQVARKLNLGKSLPPDSKEYQALIDGLRRSIDLHVKGQDLFTVTVQSDNPVTARDVTAEIVNQYIALSSTHISDKTDQMKTFLNNQLTVALRELKTAQDKVTAYKQDHPNEIPDVQSQNVTQLQKLRAERDTDEGQLNGQQNSLNLLNKELKSQPAEIVAQRTTQDNQDLANLRRNRKNLDAQLQYLLKDFTEKHPKVVELRSQMTQMDQEIATQMSQTTQTETRAANPRIGTLNDQITQMQVQIAASQANISKMNTQIATLEAWQKQMPLRVAELDTLNNAVQNEREQVDRLRKQLNDSDNAAAANSQGEGPSFELYEPPRLNVDPVSPNPKKFMVLGAAMAVFSSIALIYLLMLLDSAVRSVDEARRLLQMPVLGVVQSVVTLADTVRQRRRRRFRTVGFGFGALLLVCVIALGMTVLRKPLQDKVQDIRSMLSNK